MKPVLIALSGIELIGELLIEGNEPFKGKARNQGKHGVIEQGFVHVAEYLQEVQVAVSNVKLPVDDYDRIGNRPEEHVHLALRFLSHLGHAHLGLSHARKVCDGHVTAGIVAAATAVELIGLRGLAEL